MKLMKLEDLKERIGFGRGNNGIELTFELASKLLAVAEAAQNASKAGEGGSYLDNPLAALEADL